MSDQATRDEWTRLYPCHECDGGVMYEGGTCYYCHGWGFYGPGYADLDQNGDPDI